MNLPSGTPGCDALNLPEDLLQSLSACSLPQDLADKMRKLTKDKLERAISDHNYAKAADPQEMEQAALRWEALASL